MHHEKCSILEAKGASKTLCIVCNFVMLIICTVDSVVLPFGMSGFQGNLLRQSTLVQLPRIQLLLSLPDPTGHYKIDNGTSTTDPFGHVYGSKWPPVHKVYGQLLKKQSR